MKQRQRMLFLFVPVLLLICYGFVSRVFASGDPGGDKTYYHSVEGIEHALTSIWLIYTASIVFVMNAGICLIGGFLRPQHTLKYATHVFMDCALGAIIFWFVGYAFLLGGSNLSPGLESGNFFIGFSGWMLMGDAYDVRTINLWMFNVVFATISVSFIAGAVAERIKLVPWIIYSVLFTGFIYPVFAHWIWADGWIANLPFGSGGKDFSGSAIVHMVGGSVALAGAWALGPRNGRYGPDGKANPAFPEHNMLFGIVGTIILMFGWFGFNPGATLNGSDLRMSVICVNTFLSACSGALSMFFFTLVYDGKANVRMMCDATIAGMAAITCPCAWIAPWASIVVGIVAGFTYLGARAFVRDCLKVDDPLSSVAVHLGAGMWGILSLGIFADGTYGGVKGLIVGHGGQMIAQIIIVLAAFVWAFGLGCFIMFILKHTIGLRVPPEVEEKGVDSYFLSHECYPKGE